MSRPELSVASSNHAGNGSEDSAPTPESALPVDAAVGVSSPGRLRLADLILREMKPILEEWDDFAASQRPAAEQLDPFSLRDHAKGILNAVVLDLGQVPSAHEQDQEATGRAPVQMNASVAAARTHAVLRAKFGFDVIQMASEYSALRASILRRWVAACQQENLVVAAAMQDAGRFNEAIDQALMGSLSAFTQEVERTRSLFLAVVGHDLRNPLMSILSGAQYLTMLPLPDKAPEVVDRITRGGRRIRQLLDDLVDYNHAALGKFITVKFAEADLAHLCALEIADLQSAHNDRRVTFHADGDLHGVWDSSRLQQLLSNLLKNALDYGAPDEAIEVRASAKEANVTLSVLNRGTPILADVKMRIFEPLVRDESAGRPTQASNLGLGLFIAREIARAHRGSIDVQSDDQTTVFTVHMPRDARAILGTP